MKQKRSLICKYDMLILNIIVTQSMCLFSGLLFGRTAAKKAAQWEWTHGLTHLLNPKSTNARPRAFLLACVHRYSSKWKLLTTQFSFDGHSLMRAMFLSSNCQSIPPVGCCYHWQISKCAYCSSFSLDYENGGGGFVFLSCMMMWCFAKGADKHFIRKCIPISALAAGSPSPGGGSLYPAPYGCLSNFCSC